MQPCLTTDLAFELLFRASLTTGQGEISGGAGIARDAKQRRRSGGGAGNDRPSFEFRIPSFDFLIFKFQISNFDSFTLRLFNSL
jgi:hypothetical protein